MDQMYEQYFNANPSIIDKIFTGIQRSVVTCANCEYESIMYKPFSALSLSFESNLDKALKKQFETTQFDS